MDDKEFIVHLSNSLWGENEEKQITLTSGRFCQSALLFFSSLKHWLISNVMTKISSHLGIILAKLASNSVLIIG